MPKKNHNRKRKRSPIGNAIPPAYGEYPPMLTRWMTEIDNYARHKKHRTPRALRHHYE